MNVVIFAGGTGSIALQRGLHDIFFSKFDQVNLSIIVNAYDNGLSTGAVRKVMDGKILGPSDVRKNQTTRLELINHNSPLLPLLNIRFTEETHKAHAFCLAQLNDVSLSRIDLKKVQLMREAIDVYFSMPLANRIDYTDFSLANIIYAGFAAANGNSLRAAAKIMADIMDIEDNVILNDDYSLFLGAKTASGKMITDEGDIVSWGNTEDPFVDVFFTDAHGTAKKPLLSREADDAITQADLIILSSGTQWSSLIPTYASIGFRSAIEASKAKILMVMNRVPDKDSPGQTADDIINILVGEYFPPQRIHLIVDSTSPVRMNTISETTQKKLASVNQFNLFEDHFQVGTKHSPNKLARAVGMTYFREYLGSSHFIFDYDDTLVARGNRFPRCSKLNAQSLTKLSNVAVCTGNSIKAVNLRVGASPFSTRPNYKLAVFADGGVNKYLYNMLNNADANPDDGIRDEFVECIDPAMILDGPITGAQNIVNFLVDMGIPKIKIENRGDVMVAIKPIDPEYRDIIVKFIQQQLIGSNLIAKKAGRTTIEIANKALSKRAAIEHILNQENVARVTYVGDETLDGNDLPASELAKKDSRLKVLSVGSPIDTAFFLLTLGWSKHDFDND